MYKLSFRRKGFSLGELLVVVTVLALIVIIVLINVQKQAIRAYDAQRKTDLRRLRDAFEDYYNDKGCYPLENTLSQCGSTATELSPHIERIPCDPQTKEAYLYMRITSESTGSQCTGYRLFAALGDTSDPDIVAAGCSPVTGCGYEPGKYNYGISMGGSIIKPGFNPQWTPTPTPPIAGCREDIWACNGGGICQNYTDYAGALTKHCKVVFCGSGGLQGCTMEKCNLPENRTKWCD